MFTHAVCAVKYSRAVRAILFCHVMTGPSRSTLISFKIACQIDCGIKHQVVSTVSLFEIVNYSVHVALWMITWQYTVVVTFVKPSLTKHVFHVYTVILWRRGIFQINLSRTQCSIIKRTVQTLESSVHMDCGSVHCSHSHDSQLITTTTYNRFGQLLHSVKDTCQGNLINHHTWLTTMQLSVCLQCYLCDSHDMAV